MITRSPKKFVVEIKRRRRKLMTERRQAVISKAADALRSENIQLAT